MIFKGAYKEVTSCFQATEIGHCKSKPFISGTAIKVNVFIKGQVLLTACLIECFLAVNCSCGRTIMLFSNTITFLQVYCCFISQKLNYLPHIHLPSNHCLKCCLKMRFHHEGITSGFPTVKKL